MQLLDGVSIYSATDLNNFTECRRLTELETIVAAGRLKRPIADDEQAQLLRDKGQQHEDAYLAELEESYPGEVIRFPRAGAGIEAYRQAEQRTLDAMRTGARIIYQATFFDGSFLGHADFLERVEVPSDLGPWSYEAIDTKLALSTKPYFILQLCNYSEHLARLQGRMPDRGHVVFGNRQRESYRLKDYLAFYRNVKKRFTVFAGTPTRAQQEAPSEYPVPCGHCGICPWNETCEGQREADDHLSIVAWMRRDQTAKLESAGIATVRQLAQAEVRPKEMHPESFEKLRRQARLQIESRDLQAPRWELLEHDPRLGFGLLPAPAQGDVYFDMEGDPMYEPGRGLEYLFGCWLPGEVEPFKAFWGLERDEEKRGFENFVDFIVGRRQRYPQMHVYHYANYEKAALRRLAQEHDTREDEVDELLRGEVLVDLYTVVRQTLIIGEDSYSIKKLERFYGMKRETEVKKGDQSIVMFERWRVERDDAILKDIENYNRDDCESTALLHQWLLARRSDAEKKFGSMLSFRPVKNKNEPCHDVPFDQCKSCDKRFKKEREEKQRSELERKLLNSVKTPSTDDEYRELSEARRARYLIGRALAYHRREAKPVYWAFFDRCENVDTLQELDKEAIGGLELDVTIAPYKAGPRDRNLAYTYRFPDQRHKLDRGSIDDPLTRDRAGDILEIDDENNVLILKRAGDLASAAQIKALIPGKPIDTDAQQTALAQIAQSFDDGTLENHHRATYDLLAARDPRVSGIATLQPDHITANTVTAVTQALDRSYLFIQGPPGSGKSTIGSQVISDLLSAGKRVGVMSSGHKAIHHLLRKVERCMHDRGRTFRGLYKSSGSEGSAYKSDLDVPLITSVTENKHFSENEYELAGGTAWLFAREELAGKFDYLFIDEAGQVSLADALAISRSAANIVLLGDPSQLAQVSLGSHALHADDSILQHLLGGETTVPPHRGIFLDVSYRMNPGICGFISDAMYDSRLKAGPKTHRQRLQTNGLTGSGVRWLPIEHTGNGPASVEEAERIVQEIRLLRGGSWTNEDGIEQPITDRDIIVVTPYNAQRKLIARKLKDAGFTVPVGTVDKFQGQEAAVVFYSMATSSGDDLPRDMEFLFEPNRFNVAISRARALSVLVCSPRLLDLPCRSAQQMALLSLVCSYVEHVFESGKILEGSLAS